MNGSESRFSTVPQLIPGSLSLITLFAILGLIQLQMPRSREADESSSVRREALQVPGPVADIPSLRLLREYLNLNGENRPESPEDSLPFLKTQLRDIFLKRRPNMRCLIATVPDPIDSHLQLTSDNAFSAIARGFQQHGFLLDRHAFPWSDELRERAANGAAQDGPSWSQQPLFRSQPGAILFRRRQSKMRGADVNELVMVLLVGETPTTGIHKPALAAALDFVASWQDVDQRSSKIRVLGPEFSGSSASLRLGLIQWWATRRSDDSDRVEIEILSGSATAFANRALLHDTSGGVTLTFHATVLPDGPVVAALIDYLKSERYIDSSQIAILTEADTTYGSQGTSPSSEDDPFRRIRRLPYPLSLSRIRSQYESGRDLRRSSDRYADRRSNLDLSLELPPYARDVLPTFSDATSAVADVTLEHILSTIVRDDIRAVGLFGTDVRDKLFLAQQIRRYAPDVQLFTVETSVLYTHAAYSQHLKGTIVASTYPLFGRSTAWTSQQRNDLKFPTDTAQGIYNATVVVLNQEFDTDVPLLDYSRPFSPVVAARPPLWLTIVGDTSLWPLVVIDDFDNAKRVDDYTMKSKTKFEANQAFHVAPPSLIPLFVFSLVSVLATTAFITVNCRWIEKPAIKTVRDWGDRFFPWFDSSNDPAAHRDCDLASSTLLAKRSGACLLFFTGLAVIQFAVTSPSFAALKLEANKGIELTLDGSRTVVAVVVAFLLSIVFIGIAGLKSLLATSNSAHLMLKHFRTGKGNRDATKAKKSIVTLITLLFAVIVCAVVLCLLALWLGPAVGSPATTPLVLAIFMERVGAFSSGVTPLLPLILIVAAICFWAICEMRRTHFLNVYPLRSPFPATSGPDNHVAGMNDRCRDLNNRLCGTYFWPTEPMDWLFLVLLFSGLYYAFVQRWIVTAEGLVFDVLFRLLAVVAFVCFAGLFIRMKAVCGLFERLLRRMGQHAMVPAYQHVPQRLKSKVAGHVFASAPHPGDMDASVRSLGRLVRDANAPDPRYLTEATRIEDALQDLHLSARNKFAKLLSKERRHKTSTYADAAELNSDLAAIAQDYLVPRLHHYWDQKGVDHEESQETETPTSHTCKWEQEAERFLCMHYVNLIRQVFAHVQNMMTFLVLMLLCLLFCFDSYPFQPHRMILTLCFGLVIWTSATIFIAMVKFNRNEVLSRLSDTSPNRFSLDRSLLLPLFAYVAVPLISLLVVRFPTLDQMFFGWVDALQQIFRT